MWNLEKDPHLSVVVRQRHRPRPAPDRDRLRAAARAGRPGRSPACASGSCPPSAASPRPSGATTPTSTSTTTCGWVGPARRPATERPAARPAPPGSASSPFDRTRPLWEFVVVEGLDGGRAAMVQKLHHTITDGEGGMRMSEQFIDLERDTARADDRRRRSHRGPAACTGPKLVGRALDTAGPHHRVRPADTPVDVAKGAGGTLVHPDRLAGRRCVEAVETCAPSVRQLVGHRRGPVAAVDRALAAAAARRAPRAASTTPRRRPRRSAAASTTSSSPRRAGAAGAVTTGPRPARRRAAHRDAGEHPGRTRARRATPSPRPGCSCPPASRTRSSTFTRSTSVLAATQDERAFQVLDQWLAG